MSKSFTTEFGSAIQGIFVKWTHTPDPAQPTIPLVKNNYCSNSLTNNNCNLDMEIQLNLYTLPLSTAPASLNGGIAQALDTA